jgi:hypothetical protein
METKEMKKKTMTCAGSFLKFALGAGAVIGGAYVIFRLQERQNTDVRLERMEQLLTELSEGKKEA